MKGHLFRTFNSVVGYATLEVNCSFGYSPQIYKSLQSNQVKFRDVSKPMYSFGI